MFFCVKNFEGTILEFSKKGEALVRMIIKYADRQLAPHYEFDSLYQIIVIEKCPKVDLLTNSNGNHG